MRPLTARRISYLGAGVLLALGMLGCGGSRVRSQDGAVTEDPEPEPPTGLDAAPATGDPGAPPGLDAATAISPDGPRPPISPVPEPGPPPETCGGVTCPALFALVHPCRPMGMCTINLSPPLLLCYANGVRIVPETVLLPSSVVFLVKNADRTDCYRARVAQDVGSRDGVVVWETPTGSVVATGLVDSTGVPKTITCNGTSTELQDAGCIPIPSFQGCLPSPLCFNSL